jgi:hypothetical protein
MILKKLLLCLIGFNENIFTTTFTSKIIFTKEMFTTNNQVEIFYENELYKIIGEELTLHEKDNGYEKYKFLKSFQINKISENLQQVNIDNKTLELDHKTYYYFEIINVNKNNINTYNKIIFQNHIKDKKVKPLEDNIKNIQFTKKIYDILSSKNLKAEFIGDLEAATLFRIKKSSLKKFKKFPYVYAVESVQNGEKDRIENKCMVNTLKDSLIAYYYELKQYKNTKIINNYYETLSMFGDFLSNLQKYLNTLSRKEKKQLTTLILNPENSMNTMLFLQEVLPKIIEDKNNSIKEINNTKDLTDEDFNEIINKALNEFEKILLKEDKKAGTNPILVVMFCMAFNSILLKNNKFEHFMANLSTTFINYKIFNLSRINLFLPMYIPMHIQYIYFSFNEKNIKDYKNFIIDWYNKFDKNSLEKTFSETKYKI